MPEQIRCPDCATALRVPESLLGSLVKCPKCQTTFTADLAPPEPLRHEETPTYRPAPDEEEPAGDYETREDEMRPRRRRRRRFRSEAAESAVAGPAIALMVSAGLGICSNFLYMVWRIFDVSLTFTPPSKSSPPGYQTGYMLGLTMVIGGSLLGIIMCFVVLTGAIKMKNLRSHGFAMTACILSMIPLYCCCLLGLPFGIWGLVVLNNPDVKNAFS